MNTLNETQIDLNENTTVADVVAANFSAAGVFTKYGIDFCCGGKKSIKKAAEEKHAELHNLISDLKISLSGSVNQNENFQNWNPAFLADYIENTHHVYVRAAIERILVYANKVAMRHGENHSEMIDVAASFELIAEELLSHMMKEEQILFPYIRKIQSAFTNHSEISMPGFGTVLNPIRMMEHEHDNAGLLMHKINALTNNYKLKPEACTTWRILFDELKQFEYDLHKHVHLENNILFPKAIELEQKALSIKNKTPNLSF